MSFGLHWLSLTLFPLHVEPEPKAFMRDIARRVVAHLIGDHFDPDGLWMFSGHGARRYGALYTGPQGCKLYTDPVGPVPRRDMHLEIPGEMLESCSNRQVGDLFLDLQQAEYEPVVTRVDLAFDHAPFKVVTVRKAHAAGNFRSVAEKNGYIESAHGKEGRTFYLGSRSSERFLRIYDQHGFTRVEMELHKPRANLVFIRHILRQLLNSSENGLFTVAMGLLRDYVDFVDASADDNKSRCPLLPWWAKFVGSVPRLRVLIPRQESDLGDWIIWLIRQAGPTLAAVYRAMGPGGPAFLDQLLRVGESRMNRRHHAAVQKAMALRQGESKP